MKIERVLMVEWLIECPAEFRWMRHRHAEKRMWRRRYRRVVEGIIDLLK
jgi:hypothetical protein